MIAAREWPAHVARTLRPPTRRTHQAIDLFCGAGGLSLGFASAGFRVTGYDESDDAVATYRKNLGDAIPGRLHTETLLPTCHVLLAGPPCQPWSQAGNQLGSEDPRDGLQVVSAAIKRVQPRIGVVENVPGIARSGRRVALDSFEEELRANGYRVHEARLNAADFGVPQRRVRVFVVFSHEAFTFPAPTKDQVTTRHAIGRTASRQLLGTRILSSRMDESCRQVRGGVEVPHATRPSTRQPCTDPYGAEPSRRHRRHDPGGIARRAAPGNHPQRGGAATVIPGLVSILWFSESAVRTDRQRRAAAAGPSPSSSSARIPEGALAIRPQRGFHEGQRYIGTPPPASRGSAFWPARSRACRTLHI